MPKQKVTSLSNASSATLPPPSHGSGPEWLATPSLYDSFIRYSMPVYPGAIQPKRADPTGCAASTLQRSQRLRIGSTGDSALGDDRRHVAVRSDIEGGILHARLIRRDGDAEHVRHLRGRALLDGDFVSRRQRE